MLRAGAQVDGTATEKLRPLSHACFCATPETIRLLLQGGADVNKRLATQDGHGLGLSPLGALCAVVTLADGKIRTKENIVKSAQILLAAGADSTMLMGPTASYALHYACEGEIPALVR